MWSGIKGIMMTKNRFDGLKFSLLMFALLSGLMAAACPAGMVSYWRGENNAQDSINDNDGTWSGTESYGTGAVGQSFYFTGGNTIQIPANSNYQTQEYTIEFWAKPTSLSTDEQYVINRGTGVYSPMSYIPLFAHDGDPSHPGELMYYMHIKTSIPPYYSERVLKVPESEIWVDYNAWHHVAFTYSPATSTGELYIDGVNTMEYPSMPYTTSSDISMRFGNIVNFWDNYYIGYLDEIAFYSRALSASEVQQHYNGGAGMDYCEAGVPPEPTCPAGMVGYWKGEGNANDEKSLNNGVWGGTAAYTSSGKIGQAFNMDGNSYIDLGNSASLQLPTFTAIAWAKSPSNLQAIQSEYIVGYVPSNNNNYGEVWTLRYLDPGFSANMWDGGWNGDIRYGTVDSQWHQLAITYDGSTEILYVDGVNRGSKHPGIYSYIVGHYGLRIGAYSGVGCPSCPANMWNGQLDEIALYNTALSGPEIQQLYSDSQSGIDYCGRAAAPPEPAPTCGQGDTQGIVSYWKAEDNADDVMGANNGAMYGSASFTSHGAGKAFDFNGQSGAVKVLNPTAMVSSNGLTLEQWVYLRSSNDAQYMIGKYGSANDGWRSYIRNSGTGIQYQGLECIWPPTTTVLPLNTWVHVAATVDDLGKVQHYLNGNPDGSLGTSCAFPPIDTGELDMGKPPGYELQYFNGGIDEIAVYNRALSASEIQAHYQRSNAGEAYCTRAAAPEPTCTDVIQNQDETDVDCGGSCPDCAVGKMCSINNDCQTNICQSGYCAVPPPELIYNSEGGTVADQGITVTVPAGALPTSQLLVTIVQSTHSFAAVAGTTIIGQPLDIGPQCIEIMSQSTCESTNGCQWNGACSFIPFVSPVTISMPGDCSGTKKIYQQKIAKYIGTSWIPVVTCTPINRGGGFYSCTASDGRVATWNQISCMMSVQTMTFSSYAVTEYNVQYCSTQQLSSEGTHTVNYRATDTYGNAASGSDTVKIDLYPPSTLAQLTGVAGDFGWYTSDVVVDFIATDSMSGVAATYYSLDNETWSTWAGADTLAVSELSTVYYYSEDLAGLKGDVETVVVQIDKTEPVITFTEMGTAGNAVIGGDGASWWTSILNVNIDAVDGESGIRELCSAIGIEPEECVQAPQEQ